MKNFWFYTVARPFLSRYANDMFGYSQKAIEAEAERLFASLKHLGWTQHECAVLAPYTLRIRDLAKIKNAVILAHSYQLPEIIFGISDFRGDSLGLAEAARDTHADVIVFCGVRFMAETAKILSPRKTVIHPEPDAGCSLSESVTAEAVRRLRKQYPHACFVCYVNTTAEVKAECDVVCTSGNALSVIEGVAEEEVVFLPDKYMGLNLQSMTRKRIHVYDGGCIVHKIFCADMVRAWKQKYPDVKILVHTESAPEVVALADLAGGTGDMVRYVKESPPDQKRFMLVTECGLSDRLRVEFPEKEFIGPCVFCPHMKRIDVRKVLQAIEQPRSDQIVVLREDVRVRALRAIERMFDLTKKGAGKARVHSGMGEKSG